MTLPRTGADREAICRLILRFLAICFLVAGASFLLRPDETIRSINGLGARLGDFTPAPPSALRFWLTLAVAYMLLVTLLAWGAQRDLRRHRSWLLILAAGKGCSSLLALIFYWVSSDCFIYLLNFLVDGSITVTVLGVWVAAAALPERPRPPARDRSTRVLESVLEALVPAGGPFPETAGGRRLAESIDRFAAGAGAAGSFRALLLLLDLSPFFLPPIWMRPFSRLGLEDRVRVLEAWDQSRFWPRRQAVHFLKVVATAHFYADPGVQRRLGYPPPLERVPRDQRPPARRTA